AVAVCRGQRPRLVLAREALHRREGPLLAQELVNQRVAGDAQLRAANGDGQLERAHASPPTKRSTKRSTNTSTRPCRARTGYEGTLTAPSSRQTPLRRSNVCL